MDMWRVNLIKEFKYPKKAVDNKVQGKIWLRFTVSKAGKMQDVEVMRGLSPELDAEAVRALSTFGAWEPALKDGRTVAVRYIMPIDCSLSK